MVGDHLDVGTVGDETPVGAHLLVLLAGELGEPVVLGDSDSLATGELELGAAQGLDAVGKVAVLAAHRQQGLANVDAGHGALGLAEGAAHTRLQTIGAGARQHLVDAENVEGVHTDAHVERVLAAVLGDVLVAANAGGFQSLAGL